MGLDNLVSVGTNLSIHSNSILVNLEGLNNITSLEGNLNDNDVLTNLCDIKKLIINGQITSDEYFIENNFYNPNYAEIQNINSGGCEK